MKRFCLLGVLAVVLTGCGYTTKTDGLFVEKSKAATETDKIFAVRAAQEEYRKYLQGRLDDCKAQNKLLTRDQDGILVCVEGPKAPAEQK